MSCRMFRKGLLVIWILVAALVVTTTVHVRELPGIEGLECSGAVHSETEDDRGQTPGEVDKGTVHHHGCHGASSFLAGNGTGDVMVTSSSRAYPPQRVAALLPRPIDPGLRPPIA